MYRLCTSPFSALLAEISFFGCEASWRRQFSHLAKATRNTRRERERSTVRKKKWSGVFHSPARREDNMKTLIKRNIYSYINVSQCKYQLKIKLERWARISSLAFLCFLLWKFRRKNFPPLFMLFLLGKMATLSWFGCLEASAAVVNCFGMLNFYGTP